MRQPPKKISQTQLIIEQLALLFTSFIWTTVILSVLIFVWAVQDVEANWDRILGVPSTPTPDLQTALLMQLPTRTPWPGPPPSPTPTETLIPSATPTLVIKPPDILPDTPNQDDPTPIAVATQAPNPVAEATPGPPPTATDTPVAGEPPPAAEEESPATPTPTATATPIPEAVEAGPTRLVIASVGIDAPVVPVGWDVVEQNGVQYSVWHVADYAVGWHKTTALPGQPGNTVMAGHHNVNGEVFKELVNVEVGDEVTVYVGDTAYQYRVELKTIVKEKGESLEVRRANADWIAPTTDERLTLVTCWPYTNNTHRVIVVAKPSGPN